MTPNAERQLKKIFAVKWIIYGMLCSSIFFYFFIAVVMKKLEFEFAGEPALLLVLRNVFALVAAVELFLAFFVRRNLKIPEKFMNALSRQNFNPELVKRCVEKIDDERIKRLGSVILYSNTIDILSWALTEAIAILGLVLFILSGDVLYVQAFGGVALIAMAFFRPDFPAFLRLIEDAGKNAAGSEEASAHNA